MGESVPRREHIGHGIDGRAASLSSASRPHSGVRLQHLDGSRRAGRAAERLEGDEGHGSARAAASFTSVIIQILLLDAVFSLDSVITAVGMVDEIWIMIAAVVVAVLFMMAFAGPISGFVERHPTVKILALSFLLLIGMTLVAEGLHQHIPKGYIYFAMAFSVFVEMINLRLRKPKTAPVKLHEPYVAETTGKV